MLNQYFTTPSENGGTRSFETARRLVAMGHEVEVLTSDCSGEGKFRWSMKLEEGIKVHRFPIKYSNHMGFLRRMFAFFIFAFVASSKTTAIQAAIVFASSTPLTIAIPGVFASRMKKVPLVFEVRDLWPEVPIAMGIIKYPLAKFLARSLESWAYANSSAVIALSPDMKRGVVKSGFPASNVAVIPNACDFDLFAADEESADRFFQTRQNLRGRPILLYPGTFGAVNDVRYAVNLASKLLAIGSDVLILLIGEGREKDLVTAQARFLGVLGVNLFIEDAVPKKDVAGVFSSATCVANLVAPIPALYANSANKFFDALAAQKPVLLNFNGWMTKLVTEWGCGIDTSGISLESAAEKVHFMLHDDEWLSSARVEAGKLAQKYFSRGRLIESLDEVFRAVHRGEGHLSEAIAPGNF